MVEAPSPELEARFDRLRNDLDGVEGLFEAVGAGGANASTVEALERLQHQLEADRLGTSSWRRELDRVNESQLQSLQDGLEGGRSRGRLVTDSARTVENLAAELAATRSELEGLRAELEQLRVSGNQMQQALQARSLQVEARLFERERLYRELRDKTVNLEKTRQALAESRERHRHWVRDLLSTMAEPDGVE
jgi:DNA repair exonuclease SbcCD ATPase subunit